MVRRRIVEETIKIERGRRLAERRRMLSTAGGKTVSQGELGALVGVSAAQVSKYERGTDLLDAEKVHRFAQAARCRFMDIFVPGRLDVAEESAVFRFDGDEAPAITAEEELSDLMAQAQLLLSAGHRLILRDVVLELMSASETAPRVAREQAIL